MPTVLRVEAYRFFFYAGDRAEPQHVHIEHDDKIAKFGLDPVGLQNHWRHGMHISAIETEIPKAADVKVTDDTLSVYLSDGRTISAPLAWFPRLVHASSRRAE